MEQRNAQCSVLTENNQREDGIDIGKRNIRQEKPKRS